MRKTIKTFLVGVGSVISVYPQTNYAELVPRVSPQDRMRGHWEETGRHLRSAMEAEANEQKKAG